MDGWIGLSGCGKWMDVESGKWMWIEWVWMWKVASGCGKWRGSGSHTSFCKVLHNARVRFCAQSSLSCNAIMAHFNTIGVF